MKKKEDINGLETMIVTTMFMIFLNEIKDFQDGELHVLICPITHELMIDPVFISSGIAYEREAIVNWLQHNQKSPMTNIPVSLVLMLLNIVMPLIQFQENLVFSKNNIIIDEIT